MSNVIIGVFFDFKDTTMQIERFLVCGKCDKEMPEGMSPKEWAKIAVGITQQGKIQVWCTRHDINIAVMEVRQAEDEEVKKVMADMLIKSETKGMH